MASVASDPKAAPLADDLKEYALTLATSAFPKNFFCASCVELAIDSWKLLCCNKTICYSCHAKLEFPTSCPLCEHAPLESDSCTINKTFRNTMRIWLQKQKKKGDQKSTPQIATPPVEAASVAPEGQDAAESADNADASGGSDPKKEETDGRPAPSAEGEETNGSQPPLSAGPATNEDSANQEEGVSPAGNVDTTKSTDGADTTVEPSDPTAIAQDTEMQAGSGYGNETMVNNNMGAMNGMPGQFGFGFPNQANFGMGYNGMNPMGGMPNMMGNNGWNNMNPMEFNNMNMPNMQNGMFGGFGGNMGMPGMNDMTSMNMMNYGGGYGNNGWQGGMNGGYEDFNGFNPMGAYNQSGPQYPQMMNQFPKNNYQNQNRIPANGAAFSQQKNRRGSYGNYGNQNKGPGSQHNPHSRPGSQNGPPNHDGEPAAKDSEPAADTKPEGEQPEAKNEGPQEGKAEGAETSEAASSPAGKEDDAVHSKELTGTADGPDAHAPKSDLNPIQTVDSAVDGEPPFDSAMMNSAVQPMQPYGPGMMGDFPQGQNMNMPYGGNMGFNHHHHNNYGHSGGYNGAYGAATVLTGEPRGVGVEGAPTGPRAMREGRPNTGFSSRMNSMRYHSHAATPPTPSVASGHEGKAASPRRGRAFPERDDSLRTKDKSPSRSRSRSKVQEEPGMDNEERPRSRDHESRHNYRERSKTPTSQDDDYRRERRHHRTSRYDERDDRRDARDDYDQQYRDEREDRDDRPRSASVESRHRSRRDKEKYRSSRSHRDRSREHRRRHRSRSRSPVDEEIYENDAYAHGGDIPTESSSRRKHRSEKEKHRERDRERSRDRDRERDRRDRRDRDHDRDYDRDYDYERSREKDRDRKRSRRDREEDIEERDYVDEKYRSSRRSRKDRDRERDREYESTSRAASPPPNAPTGPSSKSTDGFSIKGISKAKRSDSNAMLPPPSGPRGFQPPKGPAAERDRDRDRDHRDSSRDHRRKSSISSTPLTPTSPSVQDHYAAERERHTRERVDKDNRDRVLQSVHGRATGRANSISSSARPAISSKRSRDDIDREDAVSALAERGHGHGHDRERDGRDGRDRDSRDGRRGSDAHAAAAPASAKIPTGPAAHRDKRRKDSENPVASLFTAGLRKQAKGSRRGGVKTEGEVERDLERAERERERRW